ncbi:MAG: hypothetical protein HYV35_02480 [Lentisphaerae bacterium]|nr:hypothetical protein [Lentisphaerota bacterium]
METHPENAKRLMELADKLVAARADLYQKLASLSPCTGETPPPAAVPAAPEQKA